MTFLNTVEQNLEKIQKRTLIPIIVLIIIGITLRVYFSPWGFPSAAPDA